MSIAIYNNLMKVLSQRKSEMIRPIMAKVQELKNLNYHPEHAIKLLTDAGNKLDIVEAAVKMVYDGILNDHRPPTSYEDIKPLIEATLCSEHPKDIMKVLTAKTYCGQIISISDAQELQLEQVIAAAQNYRSAAILEDLHEALQPYVEDMIIHANMLSKKNIKVEASSLAEREALDKYFDWFGIWPPETQKAVVKTSENKPKGKIITAQVLEDGSEWYFCPKDQYEINVENSCKEAQCPFFEEKKTASGHVKKCYFTK